MKSLKPFLLRIKEGFLLGVAPDAAEGSPCVDCYSKWLNVRNVWNERAELSELRCRRDLVPTLVGENDPHVAYEISLDGNAIRLENRVFPHPDCRCAQSEFIPPRLQTKAANYALSPIYQIKCARYGTPDGNAWLTAASGEAPLSKRWITASGVGNEKEICRKAAVDEWLKKAALADAKFRMERGEAFASTQLLTGIPEKKQGLMPEEWKNFVIGVGTSQEDAAVDALLTYAKDETLARYASSQKNPMLIVGANNWIRTRVPFFLLQQYDLHLLFYPNSMQAWVVGVAAFSRTSVDEKPVFVFASDTEVNAALTSALGQVLKICQPGEWAERKDSVSKTAEESQKDKKLNMWWTHWIYRCPKISLKDLVHLEPYQRSLQNWKEYFRDGQTPVTLLDLNYGSLPGGLGHLVGIRVHLQGVQKSRGNVIGIGTWRAFKDQAQRESV